MTGGEFPPSTPAPHFPHIMKMVKEGTYALKTPYGPLMDPYGSVMTHLWEEQDLELGEGITTMEDSLLVMVSSPTMKAAAVEQEAAAGARGHTGGKQKAHGTSKKPPPVSGTPIHLDWTRAVNVLVDFNLKPLSKKYIHRYASALGDADTVAWWVFLDGELFRDSAFQDWLEANLEGRDFLRKDRLGDKCKPYLTPEHVKELESLFPGKVIQLYQKHNDIIKAPVGWAHQVINIRPSVKFAFDTLVTQELPAYAYVHSHLISPYAKMPDDYRGWILAVENGLVTIVKAGGTDSIKALSKALTTPIGEKKNPKPAKKQKTAV